MNFIRDYSLYIGWSDKDKREGILVKNLNIEFEVKKVVSNNITPSVSKISIYNLNRNHSAALQGESVDIRLLVGYVGKPLAEVCLGRAKEVRTTKNGNDIITEIVVAEGFSILNNTSVFGTIPSGKTVADVIKHVANEAGMVVDEISGKETESKLLWGYPVEGTPKQILEEICYSYRLDYTINSNRLTVKASGQPSTTRKPCLILNEDTGLLGIPEADYWKETYYRPAEKEGSKAKKARRAVDGVKLRALIDASVSPGEIVELSRKKYDEIPDGYYYVVEADYNGQLYGSTWEMNLRCIRIE
mgnify:CR=1 FL=1